MESIHKKLIFGGGMDGDQGTGYAEPNEVESTNGNATQLEKKRGTSQVTI